MCLTADSTRSGDCTGAKDQTQGSVEIMPSSRFVAHLVERRRGLVSSISPLILLFERQ
jgi:hypothetical protein